MIPVLPNIGAQLEFLALVAKRSLTRSSIHHQLQIKKLFERLLRPNVPHFIACADVNWILQRLYVTWLNKYMSVVAQLAYLR